jgi:hypothetical protein
MKTRSLTSAVLLAAAVLLAGAVGSAEAAADLEITNLTVQGTARVGSCKTLSMTVRNNGDAFTGSPTLDIRVITFPSGSPLQNRVQKDLFISPMQGGAQVSFNVTNVEFKVPGSATIQAVVDSTQETSESNEGNNAVTLSTNVSGSCAVPPSNPGPSAPAGCDLSLVFTAPTGTTLSTGPNTFTVRAENEGTGSCDSTKLRLYRYNGGHASGYGGAVGGTRNIWTVPALSPGQSVSHDFVDKIAKGVYTYKTKVLGAWNDDNNNNHLPQKTVKAQ